MALTGIQLRCPLADCETLEFAAAADLESGDIVIENDVVCVVLEDTDTGDTAVGVTKAPAILLPCAAQPTTGFDTGEKVYFDGTDSITETASGGTLCGTVLDATALGATTVLVNFDGRLSIVA